MNDAELGLVCAGIGLVCAALFMIYRRITSLPRDLYVLLKRERDLAESQALDALTERVALKSADALYALTSYQAKISKELRDLAANHETRALMAERRGEEAATSLRRATVETVAALARVPSLLAELDVVRVLAGELARERNRARATQPDRLSPILPPSIPPPLPPNPRTTTASGGRPRWSRPQASTTRTSRPASPTRSW